MNPVGSCSTLPQPFEPFRPVLTLTEAAEEHATRPEKPTMTPRVKVTVEERNGRKSVSTGSPWEPVVGYSRAVRAGDLVFVTGTVGLEPDGRYGATAKTQARRALEIIVAAIEALGGKAADVVR